MGLAGFKNKFLKKIKEKLKHTISGRGNDNSFLPLHNEEETPADTTGAYELLNIRNATSTPCKKPTNLALLKKSENTPMNNVNVAQINTITESSNVQVIIHEPRLLTARITETACRESYKLADIPSVMVPVNSVIDAKKNEHDHTICEKVVDKQKIADVDTSKVMPKDDETKNEHKETLVLDEKVSNKQKISEISSAIVKHDEKEPEKPNKQGPRYENTSECHHQTSSKHKLECDEPQAKRMKPSEENDQKFVVNMFESRPSKRWSKKTSFVNKTANHSIEILQGGYLEFAKYKRQRDGECMKMAQASNLLETVKKSKNRDWIDRLLVEKILLECNERISLLNRKISDLTYTKPGPLNKYVATVKICDFKFYLENNEVSEKYTDFYVLTASSGTNFVISGFFTAVDSTVTFPELFTFDNLTSDFQIKLKLFCIRLKTTGVLKKTTTNCSPRSKIIFKDINTDQLKEMFVLKPSFKLCGYTTVTRFNLNEPFLAMNVIQGNNLKLNADFKGYLSDMNMDSNLKGFVNFGRKINDFVYWEHKWCTLKGTILSVYNDPDSTSSAITIDLKNSLGHIDKDEHCPKKRSFIVLIDNAANVAGASNISKYYFATITNKDFKKWVTTINAVLDAMVEWKQ